MRGKDEVRGSLFSYVDLEQRIRPDHPLRRLGRRAAAEREEGSAENGGGDRGAEAARRGAGGSASLRSQGWNPSNVAVRRPAGAADGSRVSLPHPLDPGNAAP